jgi:hypothetical protein
MVEGGEMTRPLLVHIPDRDDFSRSEGGSPLRKADMYFFRKRLGVDCIQARSHSINCDGVVEEVRAAQTAGTPIIVIWEADLGYDTDREDYEVEDAKEMLAEIRKVFGDEQLIVLVPLGDESKLDQLNIDDNVMALSGKGKRNVLLVKLIEDSYEIDFEEIRKSDDRFKIENPEEMRVAIENLKRVYRASHKPDDDDDSEEAENAYRDWGHSIRDRILTGLVFKVIPGFTRPIIRIQGHQSLEGERIKKIARHMLTKGYLLVNHDYETPDV